MRGFAGFNFKAGTLNESQRQTLERYSTHFEYIGNATALEIGDQTYLFHRSYDPLHIMGIGEGEKTDGIIWGSDEKNILETLYYAELMVHCFPYNVYPNTVFYVQDGEVYQSHEKGNRVSTPNGKGIIYSIDDVTDICVELDDDKEVFYEFSSDEITKLKDI